MSKSGTRRGTETFKVQLTAGALREDFDPKLLRAIKGFEPLRFDASEDAIHWLRRHVAMPELPLLTVLDLSPSHDLLGFCVLGYIR